MQQNKTTPGFRDDFIIKKKTEANTNFQTLDTSQQFSPDSSHNISR